MKYVITGSLGNISQPIVKALATAGQDVTVITSQQERAAAIEALGAKAATGALTDDAFVTDTFKDADVVYLMIPPNFAVEDFPAYQKTIADNFVKALKSSSAKHIVVLSSIGAHLRQGAGPIDALGYLEEQLQVLADKNVKLLRPSYFFYNLYTMVGLLKDASIVGSNFGDDKEKIALAHHLDIADRAIHHLANPTFEGQTIEYIVSDERYAADIATALGNAVGKEGTNWVTFSDEQSYDAMLQAGLQPSLASLYVQMGKGIRDGKIQEDYYAGHQPLANGRKLEGFAEEFAQAYKAS